MAKIHILDQVGPGAFNAVAHFLMPGGNNSVGVAWKTAYLASFGSGAPTSILKNAGNNNPSPGQISSTEFNSVVSGDTVEVGPFLYSEDATVSMTTAQRQANMDLMADRAINEFKTSFSARFSFYGYTQGVAS